MAQLQLTTKQAQAQALLLGKVRPELAAAYRVALRRWMGDKNLMALGLPYVVEGHRSNAVQAAYHAQGRESVAEVRRLRRMAGLGVIEAAEARRIITYKLPGTSTHNPFPSQAIDVALLQEDGTLKWDAGALLLFSRLLRYADKRIRWGGDWDRDGRTDDEKFHDWPHFELTV